MYVGTCILDSGWILHSEEEFMRYVARVWIDIRIIYSELPVAPVGPWRKSGEFDYFRDYG
jgi:hypothetical protein